MRKLVPKRDSPFTTYASVLLLSHYSKRIVTQRGCPKGTANFGIFFAYVGVAGLNVIYSHSRGNLKGETPWPLLKEPIPKHKVLFPEREVRPFRERTTSPGNSRTKITRVHSRREARCPLW